MNVLTLEGIFYEQNDFHEVADDELGTVQVEKSLEPFFSQQVNILIHHSPQILDTSRWGGGCCYLEPQGFCPATHHITPSYLFQWEWSGSLTNENVDQIPWHMLCGHRCKFCVVSTSVQNHPTVVDLQRRISELLGKL